VTLYVNECFLLQRRLFWLKAQGILT